MKQVEEKVWGTYNTISNYESLSELTEIDIWKKIDNLNAAIFYILHDSSTIDIFDVSIDQLIEAQYNLEYLIYSTRKFGVEFNKEPSEVEHVQISESYNSWFKFWNDHFESMDSKVYNQFIEDKNNGKDVSKYLPSINWKDSLKKSTQKKLK